MARAISVLSMKPRTLPEILAPPIHLSTHLFWKRRSRFKVVYTEQLMITQETLRLLRNAMEDAVDARTLSNKAMATTKPRLSDARLGRLISTKHWRKPGSLRAFLFSMCWYEFSGQWSIRSTGNENTRQEIRSLLNKIKFPLFAVPTAPIPVHSIGCADWIFWMASLKKWKLRKMQMKTNRPFPVRKVVAESEACSKAYFKQPRDNQGISTTYIHVLFKQR